MQTKGKAQSFGFGVPTEWEEQSKKKHSENCYHCMIDLEDFNCQTKKTWIYPNLKSARRFVTHCKIAPMPQFCYFSDDSPESNFLQEASVSDACIFQRKLYRKQLSQRN